MIKFRRYLTKKTMSECELSDEERAEYEQQWEELDEKVILAQILTELQQIRLAVTPPQDQQQARDAGGGMFECKRCGATVEADERGRHASGEHRAPPGMAEEMFEKA